MADLAKSVRIPRQKRSLKTRQRIVRAAIKLFSEKGYYNTNSNEIAAKAGVSIGSFYAYFTDKKQLFLEALKYENLEEMRPNNTLEDKSLEAYLLEFIQNILQVHKIINPQFHQEISAMRLMDPDVKKVMDEQDKSMIDYTYQYLKAAKKTLGDQIKIKNLRASAFIMYNAIEKVIHEIAFSGTGISEDQIIKELANMLSKYIICDLPSNVA
jgi:AcrR family transcriptional regulator